MLLKTTLNLFNKPVKEEARDTSFENEEQNYKLTDYFNKIPNDSLFLSSICLEILIKEEEGNESLNGDNLRESVYYGKRYIKQVHENIERKSNKESMRPICGKNLK